MERAHAPSGPAGLKVLHLPHNIASQISDLVRAQRELGIDARGIVVKTEKIQSDRFVDVAENRITRSRLVPKAIKRVCRRALLKNAVRWADVVHWHFGCETRWKRTLLDWIGRSHTRGFVEFWGSEIRIPDVAWRDNPYFERMVHESAETFPESWERSLENQKAFAAAGFQCIIPGFELQDYLDRDLFPRFHLSETCVFTSDYVPVYPDPDQKRPLIVHMPSDFLFKGTRQVLAAIRALKKDHEFEFRLIHDVPHEEALSLLRGCDIMLDQFNCGAYGRASLESMASGKPTVAYLKPSIAARVPRDFPLVNASQDNLVEVVGRLIRDGALRREIGVKSRAFVERHHDARVIADGLLDIYLGKA